MCDTRLDFGQYSRPVRELTDSPLFSSCFYASPVMTFNPVVMSRRLSPLLRGASTNLNFISRLFTIRMLWLILRTRMYSALRSSTFFLSIKYSYRIIVTRERNSRVTEHVRKNRCFPPHKRSLRIQRLTVILLKKKNETRKHINQRYFSFQFLFNANTRERISS